MDSSRSRRKHRVILAAIVLIECLRHLVFFSSGPAPIVLDAAEYWESGAAVAEGDLFQKTVNAPYRTPIYPYFLAAAQRCFGDRALLAVVVGQHLLVFSTTLVTYLLAGWLTGRKQFALYCYVLLFPQMLRFCYANAILTESLFMLPFTAGMGALLLYERNPSYRLAAAAGLLLGLATMVRPVPQLLVPALGVLMILTAWLKIRPWDVRQTAKHVALLLGFFGLLLLPCVVRNKVLYDEVFLTKLPGLNKWAVAFRDGSGGDLPWPETENARRMEKLLDVPPGVLNDRHAQVVRRQLLEAGLSIQETEKLMEQVSLDAIRAHPGRFAWKAFKRVGNFWRCVSGDPPDLSRKPADYQGQQPWKIPILSAAGDWFSLHLPSHSLWWNQLFSLISLAAAVRLLFLRDSRWQGIVLFATYCYFCTLTGLVEIENARYRMVLEPLMVLGIILNFSNATREPSISAAETGTEA